MAALQRSTDRPKRKVRKNTGRGIVLRRRPCQTSPSLEALVVDNGIPRIYAWGVCQYLKYHFLGVRAEIYGDTGNYILSRFVWSAILGWAAIPVALLHHLLTNKE